MDVNIRLRDTPPGGPVGDRRRRLRHKLHTPVYASFNTPNTGMVLDLSELTDLHEDGFAVQASEKLEVNRAVNLCLDLPETKAFVHGTGHVVWSDGTGRGGIRFSGLPEQSQRLLKEWLFVNLLVSGSNHAARAEQIARHVEEKPPMPRPALPPSVGALVPDLSKVLSSLDAIHHEVRAAGGDLDTAFNLITERALSLTGASGAALAFLSGDKMLCRARAGEPALSLGTPVDVKQGLSGECVRSARMIACEDAEIDPRVDREVCRMLGIGSILAAPIVSDFRVVGLLEVFSPGAHAFTEVHETALDRLVGIVPTTPPKALPRLDAETSQLPQPAAESDPASQTILGASPEPNIEAQKPPKGVPVRLSHLVLLGLTAAFAFLSLGYLLAPTIQALWLRKAQPATSPAVALAATGPSATKPGVKAMTLEELRKLAEKGDAEAQWDMASLYHSGTGVPQDDAQAVHWFLRAAEQGHVNAQSALGAYYWAGRGVRKDLSKAYFWSLLALAQGDEGSKSRLEGLASQMTRAEVTAARQQADDWLRRRRAAAAK
jgi:GAF domain/Sel1 repeat/PilZ domain